jgi:hypothetical protein
MTTLNKRSVWVKAIGIESGQLWLKGAAIQLEQYHPIFAGDSTITHPQAVALVAYTNMVRTAIKQICMEAMQLCARSVGARGLLPPQSIERIILLMPRSPITTEGNQPLVVCDCKPSTRTLLAGDDAPLAVPCFLIQ